MALALVGQRERLRAAVVSTPRRAATPWDRLDRVGRAAGPGGARRRAGEAADWASPAGRDLELGCARTSSMPHRLIGFSFPGCGGPFQFTVWLRAALPAACPRTWFARTASKSSSFPVPGGSPRHLRGYPRGAEARSCTNFLDLPRSAPVRSWPWPRLAVSTSPRHVRRQKGILSACAWLGVRGGGDVEGTRR